MPPVAPVMSTVAGGFTLICCLQATPSQEFRCCSVSNGRRLALACGDGFLGPDLVLDAGNLGADHLGMARQPTKFRPGAPQGVGQQLQLVGETWPLPRGVSLEYTNIKPYWRLYY